MLFETQIRSCENGRPVARQAGLARHSHYNRHEGKLMNDQPSELTRTAPSSDEGFRVAMDISCHSFVRMARLAESLMPEGGTLLAMSYHGADKVVPNYNLMGPVKAALESAVRYLAYELGHKHIRVHAVSPGPLKTRAAAGLKDFDVFREVQMRLIRLPLSEEARHEDH
jgi:enoyl-[acyl-carrier protein] reductase I